MVAGEEEACAARNASTAACCLSSRARVSFCSCSSLLHSCFISRTRSSSLRPMVPPSLLTFTLRCGVTGERWLTEVEGCFVVVVGSGFGVELLSCMGRPVTVRLLCSFMYKASSARCMAMVSLK